MAGIEQYLNLIENAIYGKDVRQAIHDGIQQCYYEGHAGSTDLEARHRLDVDEANISSLGSRMTTAEGNITLLDARVDEIVAPSGQAPSAAEVADARVGADGTVYSSLGDAVRLPVKHLYDGVGVPKRLTGSDEEQWYDTESLDSAYVSDRVISAGKYISEVNIKAGRANTGALFLIDQATNEVLFKKTVDLVQGWNTIYWGVQVPSDCVFAAWNTRALFDSTTNSSLFPDSYFSTEGLYEMRPVNPLEGDVVTISKSVSGQYFTFAIQWVEAEGLIYDAIEEAVDNSPLTIHSKVLPDLLANESGYNSTSSGTSLYVSDRVIPSNSVLKNIKVKSASNITGRIIVVDNSTKKVTYAKAFDFKAGWNYVDLFAQIESDSLIGLEATRCLFASQSTSQTSYASKAFCTDGLYEGAPVGCAVGSTLTITKTASNRFFIFAAQWEYDHNDVSYTANGMSIFHSNEKQNKVKFNLNNGALLSYKKVDGNIGYMGRWFDYNGKPCTNNDGSELYFKTKGASEITAIFGQISTQYKTPYIAVSIDGGDFARQKISNTSISLPDTAEHIVRIVIDGMTESQGGSKWLGTLGVYVDSITVNSGEMIGVYPRNKVGMFFGDSITEGINAIDVGADADVNSAIGSYPYFCCEELNAVSYRVGYGATGMTTTGSFNTCANAIDYLYENHPTGEFAPDFIVINHGVNDNGVGASDSNFINAYIACINKLRAKYGSLPIFCVVPFKSSQPYSSLIKNMCDDYSNTYFVSSAGWNGETTDSTHLSVNGAENNGKLLAKAILDVLGESYFLNLND